MTETRVTGSCPDAETLAAFGEGRLRRDAMPALLAHVETCDDCLLALKAVTEASEPARRFRTLPWLAAAAVVVIALIAAPLLWRSSRGTEMQRLVALASPAERATEGRLSGGFPWARFRGPARATSAASDPRRLELMGVAGDLVAEANRRNDARRHHAAGVALLMIDLPEDAIARLRSAAELQPDDAKTWSDLGTAQHAAAQRFDRPSLEPQALASIDRALQLDPKLPEALFNRALVLERMGLTGQAREAWQAYLAADPSSPWASEARQRLARLRTTTDREEFDGALPRLEDAALRGDRTTVVSLVRRYRQHSRTRAEAITLGEWGKAYAQAPRGATAARHLGVARAIGDALVPVSGEALLRDAVAAIDHASSPKRAMLAEAQTLYLRGRMAYGQQRPAEAEPDLRRAAGLFAAGRSPLALVARYFAANTRFDRNDVGGARDELEALRIEAAKRPQYLALGAQIAWQLALCAMSDGDWESAYPLVREARDAFRSAGELDNTAFLDALLADTLHALGRHDDGWRTRIASFAHLSISGYDQRLGVSLDGAARMELRGGDRTVARAMLRIEESVNRASGNGLLLTNTLVRAAALSAGVAEDALALRQASEARAIALALPDAALRARALTDASFALGAATLLSDARRAHRHLTEAIDGYRELERPFFLPEVYLLRARAALRDRRPSDAIGDFEQGIEVMERHRLEYAQGVVGTGIFDAGRSLFEEMIRLHLDRGDPEGAFAYAERARVQIAGAPAARGGATVAQLRRRLAGSGTAVLALAVLHDEVVAFCVTAQKLTVARSRIPRTRLATLAASGIAMRAEESEALYDLLIRPVERELAGARVLIVVGDPLLESIPFASLRDSRTKQHLVQRIAVAGAPSAGSLTAEEADRPSPQSLVAVSLHPGDAAALPEAAGELADIARLYRRSVLLQGSDATFARLGDHAADADVMHIAGHTERQPGEGDAALLFGSSPISWRDVAAGQLRSRPIVVLAACDTLLRPPASRSFTLSLGGSFLAAGARDVVGTLAPVPDADARLLFDAFHRHLRATGEPALALRRTQLDALRTPSGARLPWQSLALLTTRIPHRTREASWATSPSTS